MIRKLRIKFILASMLTLLLVLSIIFCIVGVLNFRKILTDSDNILAILQKNDGIFPIDGRFNESSSFSAELPYESRFFFVFLAEDGEVITVNTEKVVAVDATTAIDYATSVFRNGRMRGFINDYRYTVYTVDDEIHIVFLDYGREMRSFRMFLFTAIIVSIIGLLAVMLLLIFLSGRIVKPFSENYEKQKQFITDAGHELKTPLTIIAADAEILEMDVEENEWLSDIQMQTKRLAHLTDSLIQLARMDELPQTEKIEFPVSDLVEETVEAFQALAKTNNKNFSSQIQPMLSMNGDEKAIRELVTILIDNAIKYSDDGGRIVITLERKKNLIWLSVFNTAESISREKLTHFFDRFYRADQSRNSRKGGYGLGLSIASSIVASHKGKIWATTQDEKSLLIMVSFPVK